MVCIKKKPGFLDVTWKTTGHGPVRAAAVIDQVLVTLGGDDGGAVMDDVVVVDDDNDGSLTSHSTRTYIAGRHWKNGTLLWRREISSTRRPRSTTTTSVYIAPSSSGMILILEQGHPPPVNSRLWAMAPTTGAVVWDQQIPIVTPDLKTIKKPKHGGGTVGIVPVLQLVGDDRIVVSGETVLDIASGNIIFNLDIINNDSVVPLDEMARGSIDRIVCQSREFAISPTGTISMGDGTDGAHGADNTTTITTLDANELWLLKCDESGIIVLSSSVRGTTAVWDPTNANAPTRILWSAQEGLAGATAAVLVNADPALPREDSTKLLNLQQRWTAQYQSLTSPMATSEWKNHLFGLHKIALVLNSKIHRLFGLDNISGKIVYQMDLDLQADEHKIIEHADEHHQVLVMSIIKTKQEIRCTCLDASTGIWNEETTTILPIPSATTNIQQIVPMLIHTLTAASTISSTTGSATMVSPKCAVGALVVLEDGSVLVTDEAIRIPENMYTHAVTEQSIRTYRILPPTTTSSSSAAHWIGTTNFPGETIVTKAYPNRHEVTESPCNVLGDNSLLIKYINPHILVVITATTTAIGENGKPPIKISLRQQKNKKNASVKRKPAGVEDVTSATSDSVTATTSTPTSHPNPFYNLFVNVVDVVSGKLLYRIGHTQADPQSAKVLISEHWIIYSFVNIKTLKAELGVLSLYEGMIEKNGLSVFTSRPSSSMIHSSLVAPPPVVLAKTYVIPYLPTALGMTVTKAGISARRLLLATLDGKIHSLDRNILEPRRPVGPLNENEKKEGLVQYHEMIPFMPYYTISYNLTIEHVHTIHSVATHLESQTIVLAYGGPDLFMTRISPSKGFDVLPETFSRPLILLILAILAVAYYILQQLVNKKVVQQGWV